jgi:putative transposase
MDIVTVEEAAQLEGVDESTVKRNVSAGKYRTRLADEISANGRRKTLIDVHSLSIPAQIKYYRVEEAQGATPAARLSGVSEEARKVGLERLAIVNEAEEIRERYRLSVGGADGAGAVSALTALAASHKISYATLCRWRADFKREGFVGLLPKYGAGRGSRIDPRIKEAIETEWLQPKKLSQQQVYEIVAQWCAEQLLPAPSYKTVQRIIDKIPAAVATYHRSGRAKWASDAMPKETRDLSTIAVNEWWCGDHREFDCFVRVGNKVMRPWLTSWEDLRSRAIVGRCISFQPNSGTIATAFRAGVLNYGAPQHVYIDNGRDYNAHYLNGKVKQFAAVDLSQAAQGVFAQLGIRVHHAIPYSAWSKPVERWHRNITSWERELPGWCGKDNKERPEKLAEEIHGGALLTLDQFIALFDQWLAQYNARLHTAIGCAPNDLWAGVERRIPETRALDLLLMEEERRRVHPSGIKVFPGRWHWAGELALYVGNDVTVRYDRNDVGRVFVFLEGGRKFLCEAINKPLLTMGAAKEDLAAAARKKRTAEREIKAYRQVRHQLDHPDTLLAGIIAAKEGKGELSPDGGKPPEGGKVIRLITAADRQAEQIAAAPAADTLTPSPIEQAEAVNEDRYFAQLERDFEAKLTRERQAAETEEAQRRRMFEG